MFALLRLFLRCWLWLLPKRGRAALGWERLPDSWPNERTAGRRGCAAAAGCASPRCHRVLSAPDSASVTPQHASPGSLRHHLRRLLRAWDWLPAAPLLLHSLLKSLGWHRACPLAHMTELEQPARAGAAAVTAGCAAESQEEGRPQEQEEGCSGVPEEGCVGIQGEGRPGAPGAGCVLVQDDGPPLVHEQLGGCTQVEGAEGDPEARGEVSPVVEQHDNSRNLHYCSFPEEEEGRLPAQASCVPEAEAPPTGCTDKSPAAEEGCLGAWKHSTVACRSEMGPPAESESDPFLEGSGEGQVSLTLEAGTVGIGADVERGDGGLAPRGGSSLILVPNGPDDDSEGESAGLAPERSAQVQITVAIEAVEDEDCDVPFPGSQEGGGSCSEDDRNDKYSGAATSGGENDNDDLDPNWKPPEQDLIEKLIVQIEYYLSDENLEKDAFLLKHVRRNKMGYVSVKLLTSFKKVKHLTRDWRTTAYALKYSDSLELNEDNRKVRRNSPVPVFPSENLPSKMLLVHDFHLFPELQSLNKEQENGGMQEKIMEQLLKVFGSFGVISSVRILKPGRDLPPDVKRFSSRYAQVGTKECAIVEYEEVEAAIKAHETMSTVKENEVGMKVILIGMKPPKKKIPKDKNCAEESNKNRKAKSLNKRVEELQFVGDDSPVYSSSDPDSNPTSPMMERKYKVSNKLSPCTYQNNHLSPNASPRSSPWNSPSGQRKVGKISPLADGTSPEFPRKCMDYSSDSSITPSSSPWVQRRRQAQTVTQEKSPIGSPMLGRKIQNADGLPLGVLRLPKGPDGTKGFHNGVERNKPMQNLEIT
ncbi:la-related protein 6 [Lissotriton helveticus]